jgi:uncharacterized membrane protein YhiD involved in acid resistance
MIRKTFPLTVLMLSSMMILILFVLPATAQGEGFSETFDDVQLPGWEHSPEVVVRDGVLRIAPGNFAARMGSWGDFDLTFKLRFDAPGETEIQYHTNENGGYILVFTPDRLLLLRGSGPGAEPTELTSTGLGELSTEEWNTVHIILSGGSHSVTVNDSIALTAEDPNPIASGGLTFASHGERTTEVDDVILTIVISESGEPIGEAPPPQPEQPQAVQPTSTPIPDSWQSLFQNLSTTQGSTFDLGTFAINLILAVISSFILSRVYVYWGASLSNRRKFAANFMLVTVTTTFIILVVRSSVALSLGLVGALSIIRFRAAIKEPEELAYLFFTISLGIGLGDNQRMVTLLTLVVIVIVVGLAHLLRQSQADVNLNLSVSSLDPNKVDMQQVMDALEKHCSKLRLMRYDETADALEMSFVIEFHSTSDLNQARASLLALSDRLEISFMDNKGIW